MSQTEGRTDIRRVNTALEICKRSLETAGGWSRYGTLEIQVL